MIFYSLIVIKVIIGTVVSYFAKFNEKYNVKIIGNLPLGYDRIFSNFFIIFFLIFVNSLNRKKIILYLIEIFFLLKVNSKFEINLKIFFNLSIPKPTVPPVRIFGMVIGDSIAIAIVSFALNVIKLKFLN